MPRNCWRIQKRRKDELIRTLSDAGYRFDHARDSFAYEIPSPAGEDYEIGHFYYSGSTEKRLRFMLDNTEDRRLEEQHRKLRGIMDFFTSSHMRTNYQV